LSKNSSLLLGLDGIIVESVEANHDQRRVLHVRTAPEWVGVCPDCGVRSQRSRGWVLTRPRDIKVGPDRPAIEWRKQKWLCRNISCDRRSFTESVPVIPPGARITRRAKAEMARSVLDDDRSVKAVAAAYGCSWNTCHDTVIVTADAIGGHGARADHSPRHR
jgi:hypothetical protein